MRPYYTYINTFTVKEINSIILLLSEISDKNHTKTKGSRHVAGRLR
jgi:hypothetical protein